MSTEHTQSLPEHVRMRDVFHLAWPITVSMLSYTVMGVVDTLFVSRLGTGPLAAVGLAAIATHLVLAFPNGLMRGVKVNVAQRTGAGEHNEAMRLGWQGVYIAGAFGFLIAAMAAMGPHWFERLGASRAVGEWASSYFGVRVLGAPLVFGMGALTAWFQGRGDTRTPMAASLVANALNIALDPIFIFGWGPVPAMGLPGAAASTVLSIGVGLGLLVWRFLPAMADTPRAPRLDLMRAIVRIGAPVGVQWQIDVGAWVVFSAILAAAGEVELAAHVMVIRIISVSFLPGHALSEAAGVIVGHAVGAGRPEAAREAFAAACKLAVGLMFAMGVVFVAAPGVLTAPFGVEPDVAAVAHKLLIIAATFQVFDALTMVAFGSLSGAGDTRFVMVASVLTGWLVKLPVGAVLAIPLGMGAAGAWLGLTVEIMVLTALGLWRIRGDAWLIAAKTPQQEGEVIAVDEELAAK